MALSALLLCSVALASTPRRIVVVILDDVGADRIGAYAEHPDPGHTPNIDRLAAGGLLFRNAWSNPYCSPTRACLLTGRYSFRTGIGAPIKSPGHTGFQSGLAPDEPSLADALAPLRASYAIGKWHLGDSSQGTDHPLQLGFAHHAGSLHNIGYEFPGASYFNWLKTTDGLQSVSLTYATTDTVEDALRACTLPAPAFLWVATNAPHAPFHVPPDHLHTFDLSGPPADPPSLLARAMMEAADTELGRLLAALGPDDFVILCGDNGTTELAIDGPWPSDHGKGTLYEGGVRVPLIIAGPGVVAGECRALVNLTDVFATVCELAGAVSAAEDSISLVPYLGDPDLPSRRRWIYAESFRPNGPGPYAHWQQAIRSPRYKVIQRKSQADELYDLGTDRFEQRNLLTAGPLSHEARSAYLWLKASRPHSF